jgi:hypothetical protein
MPIDRAYMRVGSSRCATLSNHISTIFLSVRMRGPEEFHYACPASRALHNDALYLEQFDWGYSEQ